MSTANSRNEADIRFIGEQDGVPERAFKDRLRGQFADDTKVHGLYLVRVGYANSAPQVALAVTADAGSEQQVVSKVQEAFRTLFHSSQCLDIIFLSPGQVREVATVCRPFFQQ